MSEAALATLFALPFPVDGDPFTVFDMHDREFLVGHQSAPTSQSGFSMLSKIGASSSTRW
jgi:hypothetical protein